MHELFNKKLFKHSVQSYDVFYLHLRQEESHKKHLKIYFSLNLFIKIILLSKIVLLIINWKIIIWWTNLNAGII